MESFMLTLHECGCDKFITLIRACDKFITYATNAQSTLYACVCDKFITLTSSTKSSTTLLFAKAARRPPWRVPIRLNVKKSLRPGVYMPKHLRIQASKCPGICTSGRLSSIRPYFQASTRLYFCTLDDTRERVYTSIRPGI